MNDLTPTTPSFAFGYWRPWKENSNLFDSYLDYTKDKSLVKYGADTVGEYINQASKEHVQAINQLGQVIGRGMYVLSSQMDDINSSLGFLNRNLDIQIEQQKLTNLLLQNIAVLLRVPNSEKERQHSIELGIKFFVNAKKDSDLYADALEELLKAESLMKQDYFVLHRIGCIYLYVEKYINPEKALDYFIKAAKYASVESDPSTLKLINALLGHKNEDVKITIKEINSFDIILKDKGSNQLQIIKFLKDYENWELDLKSTKDLIDSEPATLFKSLEKITAIKIVHDLKELGAEAEFLPSKNSATEEINNTKITTEKAESQNAKIEHLVSESYEKAAFAAYVLGRFTDAVNYQIKAINFKTTPENYFSLAKYQVRNGSISEAIECLDKSIEQSPQMLIAAFKEIDLINEVEVLSLITKKNKLIDESIKQLIDKWKTVESTKSNDVFLDLNELLKKSYEIKVAGFKKYEKEGDIINESIAILESKIENFINEIEQYIFLTLKSYEINELINELIAAKKLPYEQMQSIFDKIKNQIDADILKIGSKYGGGIVVYLDKTELHGLIIAEKYFGVARWGEDGNIDANGNGIADGSGMENTKKIVEQSSSQIEKGIFRNKKILLPTAARLCLESNYNGYNDWYLPTKAELELIINCKIIKKSSFYNQIFNSYTSIWSSYEYGYSEAYLCRYGTRSDGTSQWSKNEEDEIWAKSHKGYIRPNSKSSLNTVWAVRVF
jgi:ribosomal protein L7/L12